MMEKQLPGKGELLDPGFKRVVEQGLKLRGVDFANALAARRFIRVRSVAKTALSTPQWWAVPTLRVHHLAAVYVERLPGDVAGTR